MASKIDESKFYGKWVHSNSEDNEDEIVLRPYENAPLSRGPKKIIEFKPDGKLTTSVAGADDRLDDTHGEWEIEEGNKINFKGLDTTLDGKLQISSINDDKLTLKKNG